MSEKANVAPEILEFIKPRSWPVSGYEPNPHAREERIMEVCFDVAHIYGEDRMFAMYEAGKRIGIYDESPCDKK